MKPIQMTPPRNRRRGVAIEMALAALVVVFALCTLLVTLSAYSRTDNTKQNRAFADSVALDQIGEDFLTALETANRNGTFPSQCFQERIRHPVGVIWAQTSNFCVYPDRV